jgi:hypothetical protein
MPHPQRYQGSNVGLNQLVYNCLLGAVKNPGEFDWIQVRLSSDDMEACAGGSPEHRYLDVHCSGSATGK